MGNVTYKEMEDIEREIAENTTNVWFEDID